MKKFALICASLYSACLISMQLDVTKLSTQDLENRRELVSEACKWGRMGLFFGGVNIFFTVAWAIQKAYAEEYKAASGLSVIGAIESGLFIKNNVLKHYENSKLEKKINEELNRRYLGKKEE